MNCKYCGSPNEYADNCGFCDAPLKKQRPQLKEFLYLDQAELPFGQLSLFHTYDLLILLRLVREERTKCYHLMRSVQKGSELIEIDSDTLGLWRKRI